MKTLIFCLAVATLLAACASPGPAPQLYQLRTNAPGLPALAASKPPAGTLQVLQLVSLSLPEVLERDAIVLSQGRSGVQALAGHRWAEPLRDAVPRLLRHDLALALGLPQVWATPLPAALTAQRQLRVEVLGLQADEARRSVQLQARWTLTDPSGALPVRSGWLDIQAPVQGSDVDAIVSAHRQALWQLAQALAAAVAVGP